MIHLVGHKTVFFTFPGRIKDIYCEISSGTGGLETTLKRAKKTIVSIINCKHTSRASMVRLDQRGSGFSVGQCFSIKQQTYQNRYRNHQKTD